MTWVIARPLSPGDAELADAVHPRRVDQIIGHGLEELAQQEDSEDRDGPGHDQGNVGVNEAKLRQHDVERQGDRMHGNQEAEQHRAEHELAFPEAKLGERVGGRQ